MKLGAARGKYPAAWRLIEVTVEAKATTFSYRLQRDKLRQVHRREGRNLLRTNLTDTDSGQLWNHYLQLVQRESAPTEAGAVPALH